VRVVLQAFEFLRELVLVEPHKGEPALVHAKAFNSDEIEFTPIFVNALFAETDDAVLAVVPYNDHLIGTTRHNR
jgi:hypothetical protein